MTVMEAFAPRQPTTTVNVAVVVPGGEHRERPALEWFAIGVLAALAVVAARSLPPQK